MKSDQTTNTYTTRPKNGPFFLYEWCEKKKRLSLEEKKKSSNPILVGGNIWATTLLFSFFHLLKAAEGDEMGGRGEVRQDG